MHGCRRGVCVVVGGVVAGGVQLLGGGGHAWLPGACVAARGCAWLGGVRGCWGMHGCWGCVCGCQGGMHGCWGACMVAGGREGACMVAGGCAWLLGGHVWLAGGMHRIRRNTVNEWAVRILLEYILVT